MANTMKALQTVTVGAGGVSSVTFSSIPQTYTDLVVKASTRSTFADDYQVLRIWFNSVEGTMKEIYGTGSAAGSGATSQNRMGYTSSGNNTANTFGNAEIYIPNYTSSSIKSASADAVSENNSTVAITSLTANQNPTTSPISSITLFLNNGNFVPNSTFTLYGVFNQDVSVAPAAPTIGTASDGGTGTSASVAFTGVSGAASYTATSSPGGLTGTAASSPITVTGLTTGIAYTFTVKANNPIGSSAPSAASNSVTPEVPGMFESIASATGTGSSGTITFSSIPSTYKSLQIRLKVDASSGGQAMRFNSDTGNNYARHYMGGNGSSVFAGGTASTNLMFVGNDSATSYPSVIIIDIHDYASTTKNKTIRAIFGQDSNGAGSVYLYSGVWLNTSAITSLSLGQANFGGIFGTGTVASLYGIKGA